MTIAVGLVGGTGYTGAELMRLVAGHPELRLDCVTARELAGEAVADTHPQLRGVVELSFSAVDAERLAACDVVFTATPHGVAMRLVPALLAANPSLKVVDLSADFRLRDAIEWQRWHGEPHTAPEQLEEAVYGLPEYHREAIAGARLVANPGCYPTAVVLGLAPLLEMGLVRPAPLFASAVSGTSGAGRVPRVAQLLAEAGGGVGAYGASGHRHLPEIEQALRGQDAAAELTFVPHLGPMARGIHATLCAVLSAEAVAEEALHRALRERYAAEPFVDVMPPGGHPRSGDLSGGNLCRLALHRPQGRGVVVVLSAIDNLVKGAAGQALQNMNLMFGLPETQGLAVGGGGTLKGRSSYTLGTPASASPAE